MLSIRKKSALRIVGQCNFTKKFHEITMKKKTNMENPTDSVISLSRSKGPLFTT